jgi:hypothetical protein
MVGEVMLKVLAEKFLSDTDELILVASESQWVDRL